MARTSDLEIAGRCGTNTMMREPPPTARLSHRAPLSETRPIPRRGLSRIESAIYIGISPTKFDQLVEDGRMPKPIHLDGRRLWDLRKLDQCFDALDTDPSFDQSWADFADGAVKQL